MAKAERGQNTTDLHALDHATDVHTASVGLTYRDRPFWLAAFVLVDRCGQDAAVRAVQQVRLALASGQFQRAEDWETVLRAVRQIEQLGPLRN